MWKREDGGVGKNGVELEGDVRNLRVARLRKRVPVFWLSLCELLTASVLQCYVGDMFRST